MTPPGMPSGSPTGSPLGFVLNAESPVPIFRQIVDGLRASIARGSVATGQLLPSVRTLAEELGVNPNTVQKAFSELEREGLVASERGRGMVVLGGMRQSAKAAGEDAVLNRLADAVRHARAVGLSDERFETLLRKAKKLAGDSAGGKDARDGE
ncbi:MAG: GntR family transcriptional regulator [Phycisphaerae bacterium]|jgi:GntR family transcriptional regulator|nr:GntR family transcriptional regulator [Phycisphaerae bacterium]